MNDAELKAENLRLQEENQTLKALINNPQISDFFLSVKTEVAFQKTQHDDSHKNPMDWFWTLGFLAGEIIHSLNSNNQEQALHHIISCAALLFNWYEKIWIVYSIKKEFFKSDE